MFEVHFRIASSIYTLHLCVLIAHLLHPPLSFDINCLQDPVYAVKESGIRYHLWWE